MASRRKRRQPEALRRYWASRRNPKRNFASAGLLANPRKRRSRRAGVSRRHRSYAAKVNPVRLNARRRRSYRSNPHTAPLSLMGVQFPPMDAILFTGAGIVVPPIVQAFLIKYLPAELATSKPALYVVRAASVFGPSLLVRQFVSRRAGNLMLLGGVATLMIDLVREFAPGVIPGLGAQPFLGQYVSRPGMGKYVSEGGPRDVVRRLPQVIAGTADRLSPQGRF